MIRIIKLYRNFYLRTIAGISLNMSNSDINDNIGGLIVISKQYCFYPGLAIGFDISHIADKYPISLGVCYTQGLTDAVKDVYYGNGFEAIPNGAPVKMLGSNIALNFKYTLVKLPFNISKEPKPKTYSFKSLKKRKVFSPIEIVVDTTNIEICVRDFQEIDGDEVSIEFN